MRRAARTPARSRSLTQCALTLAHTFFRRFLFIYAFASSLDAANDHCFKIRKIEANQTAPNRTERAGRNGKATKKLELYARFFCVWFGCSLSKKKKKEKMHTDVCVYEYDFAVFIIFLFGIFVRHSARTARRTLARGSPVSYFMFVFDVHLDHTATKSRSLLLFCIENGET